MGGTTINPILQLGNPVQHGRVEGRQIARARRGMVEEEPVGTAPGKGGERMKVYMACGMRSAAVSSNGPGLGTGILSFG